MAGIRPRDMDASRELQRARKKAEVQEKKLMALEKRLAVLKDVESNFASLLEMSSVGIVMIRSDKKITYVNPHLARMLGRKPAQMIDKPFTDFTQPNHANEMAELLELHVAGARNLGTFQTVVKHKNGRKVHVELEGSIIHTNDQVVDIILVRDITDRKMMETALRENEARLKTIIEHSHDIICTYNPKGIISFVNDGIRKYGYTPDKIIGKSVYSIIHPGDRERALTAFENAMKTRQSNPIAFRLRKKNGGIAHVEEFSKLVIEDGEIVQINGVIRDITDRVNSEYERSRLEEQLRQAAKMEAIGRLAGGVAHDFNNILTGINGYAEVILSDIDSDNPIYGDVNEILSAGERAAKLTSQLLAFSRRQIIDPKVMRLNDALEFQQKLLGRIIGEDVTINYKLSKKLGHIKADAGQMDQILINLATNARDAMPQGGDLTIMTRNIRLKNRRIGAFPNPISGQFVLLTVSDTGQGMTREVREKLFEPFFTTKEKGKGTGLGLATVYGIVKQNNAFIKVISRPKRGSTFKIFFPRVDESATEAYEAPIIILPTGSETILLVEDEVVVRKLARKILERKGYTVLEAMDVRDAIKICKMHPTTIHLLLTDVIMPIMTGRDLYDKLKDIRSDLIALYMSGYTKDVIAHHGVLEEDTHYIPKPFSVKSLTRKVREVLDSAHGTG